MSGRRIDQDMAAAAAGILPRPARILNGLPGGPPGLTVMRC